MEISLEELLNTPTSTPINDFTGFVGEFPIADPNAAERNNAILAVWQNDDGFYVIPTKINGQELTLRAATEAAIAQGSASYPKFNNGKDALIWAKQKNNSVNEDGTVA